MRVAMWCQLNACDVSEIYRGYGCISESEPKGGPTMVAVHATINPPPIYNRWGQQTEPTRPRGRSWLEEGPHSMRSPKSRADDRLPAHVPGISTVYTTVHTMQ